ncbi:hypothetical protein LCGC14_1958890, partial [marine sediment metagenome]
QQQIALWSDNLAKNLKEILKSIDLMDLPQVRDKPALIISGSPSLYERKQLELLAEKGFKGDIFAVSRPLKDCYEHGVYPDVVCSVDGAQFDSTFFDHDIVREHAHKTTSVMAVSVHNDMVKAWPGKKLFYVPAISQKIFPNVAHIFHLLAGDKTVLGGCGNVGTVAWAIAFVLGYNPIGMIGMEAGFPSLDLETIKRYYPDSNMIKFRKKIIHPFFGTTSYTSRVFESQRDSFVIFVESCNYGLPKKIRTINCSEGGIYFGGDLEHMWFKDFLEEFGDV